VTRETRKGANEAWFREVNERLEDRAVGRGGPSDNFEIVCECAREDCTERITIAFADYEAVRRSPTGFIVVPGHVDPDYERLAGSTGPYEIVEKFGDAGRVARIENPLMGRKQTEPG
jgi:hypothetical protein